MTKKRDENSGRENPKKKKKFGKGSKSWPITQFYVIFFCFYFLISIGQHFAISVCDTQKDEKSTGWFYSCSVTKQKQCTPLTF